MGARRPNPVAYLANTVRAPARARRGLPMVWAYFDETVVHEKVDGKLVPTHLLIAGGVSTLDKWKPLEEKWRQALSDEGVSCFHGSEFYHFRREFAWYTPQGEKDYPRHAAFRDRLADIIIEHVDEAIAFTSAVSVRDGASAKQVEKAVYKRALRDGAFGTGSKPPLSIVWVAHPITVRPCRVRCSLSANGHASAAACYSSAATRSSKVAFRISHIRHARPSSTARASEPAGTASPPCPRRRCRPPQMARLANASETSCR